MLIALHGITVDRLLCFRDRLDCVLSELFLKFLFRFSCSSNDAGY